MFWFSASHLLTLSCVFQQDFHVVRPSHFTGHVQGCLPRLVNLGWVHIPAGKSFLLINKSALVIQPQRCANQLVLLRWLPGFWGPRVTSGWRVLLIQMSCVKSWVRMTSTMTTPLWVCGRTDLSSTFATDTWEVPGPHKLRRNELVSFVAGPGCCTQAKHSATWRDISRWGWSQRSEWE